MKEEWEAKRRMNRKMDRRNRWEKKHILCMPPPVNEWKRRREDYKCRWSGFFLLSWSIVYGFLLWCSTLSSSFLHCSFHCNLLISKSSYICVCIWYWWKMFTLSWMAFKLNILSIVHLMIMVSGIVIFRANGFHILSHHMKIIIRKKENFI